jgi:hypothetical protein
MLQTTGAADIPAAECSLLGDNPTPLPEELDI